MAKMLRKPPTKVSAKPKKPAPRRTQSRFVGPDGSNPVRFGGGAMIRGAGRGAVKRYVV
jgi:hypothetical protein